MWGKNNIRKKTGTAGHDRTLWLNIALIVAFFAVMSLGIYLVRDKLLYNANEMGNNLAQSYSNEEETRISIYEMFLTMCSLYTDAAIDNADPEQAMQQGLEEYADYMSQVLGAHIIDPYAVVNGKIVAANPWEGDENYDYSQKEWYTEALAADGKIVFTDVYVDAITGQKLVTLSVKLHGEGNVLAFDILMDDFHALKNKIELPEGSTYFLFDASGTLIYLTGGYDLDDSAVQQYAAQLLAGVRDGSFESHTATFNGLDGQLQGIYYYEMSNGWTSIVTFSLQQILYGTSNSTSMYLLTGIFLILLVAVIVSILREYAEKRKVKYISDTLQILGDTYYAIYRINFETGTYETIKSSSDLEETLGKTGEYEYLLNTLSSVVEDSTYEEFKKNFNLDNIRQLVQSHIYEFGGDYQRRFREGRKWVSIKIVYNKALGLNEVIMCFREIDVEKKKELRQHELLEQALENAKRAASKKTMFFSSMSHDMRTPLNAISGMSKLARQHVQDPEKVEEYLTKIDTSSRQLTALVNDILDMARLEQGVESTLNCQPMDIVQSVSETAELFREQAQQEDRRYEVVLDVQDRMVNADAFRLNQVLNNLLSNAFKYSREGDSIRLELRQAARRESRGQYQLIVEDTGIGMTESFQERLFEPFARETVFAPTKATGTGLGMPIVKGLVQQMSGEITVQSKLGEGSRFVVSLPLQIVEAAPEPEQPPLTELEPFTLEGKRMIVAEDNELNMEITTEFLSMLGVDVLQAWNGREAVERFAREKEGSVDAILMDMQMPEMDGCAACRKIRSMDRPDAASVPIIAVTANAFAEDIAKTTEAGMNAHISKPIDFKLLSDLLQKLAQEKHEPGEH